MPGGRPTKYTPEMVEQGEDYIINYAKHDHVMPSVVGMAIVLNVGKSTLYDWAGAEDNKFSDILAKCLDYQEFTLLNKSLKNEINANIAKLALGKHGYHDKQDIKADVVATELTRAQLESKLLAQGIDPNSL